MASDTPWWARLNSAIMSTRVGWHVPWVYWRPLESYYPPVFGEEGQAAVCSSLGLGRTGYSVHILTHSQLVEHSCWCQLVLTFVQTWSEHALFFDLGHFDFSLLPQPGLCSPHSTPGPSLFPEKPHIFSHLPPNQTLHPRLQLSALMPGSTPICHFLSVYV